MPHLPRLLGQISGKRELQITLNHDDITTNSSIDRNNNRKQIQ